MAIETTERGETPKKPSFAEIAATLVQSAPQPDAEEVEEAPTGGDNVGDTEEEDFSEGNDELDASEDDAFDDAGDEQEDEQPDDEDEQDSEPDYLDIRDDDIISVMVDGEEQEVTIGDLKKAHSLEGAAYKRLQEATETRKEAHAQRTQMLEKLAAEEKTLTEALSSLDDSVFAPVIPEPNPQTRHSNPEQFLRHKEAYDADQKRIADARKAVQDRLDAIKNERNQSRQAYAEEAGQILLQEIPELRDQQKAPQVIKQLADTAKSYGYTDQEIQSALDPRMFMLVRDAMRYRQMTDKTRERPDPTNLEGQKAKKVRRLRTGNTSAKNRVRQADKKRQALVDRARKTGNPRDVAATLLVPKG